MVQVKLILTIYWLAVQEGREGGEERSLCRKIPCSQHKSFNIQNQDREIKRQTLQKDCPSDFLIDIVKANSREIGDVS